MRKLRNESGQTLLFVAVGLSVLLGFAAFATDIGIMLREQNLAQHAADSAAIAAATQLHYGATAASNAALTDASLNGFTNGSDGVTVTVSNPPNSSEVENPNFASDGFVKVTISKDTPGFFMKVFNRSSMTVAASAVATDRAHDDYCLYSLDPVDPYAVDLQGSFKVKAPRCGIVIDSSSGDALHFSGSGGTLTAAAVDVVGGDSGQTGDSTPAPTLDIPYVSNPLSWEEPQTLPSSCIGTGNITLTGNYGPACYGNGTGTITLKNVTLSSGLYIFNGPVAFAGTVTSEAPDATDGTKGVTLYLANGGLSATTNSVLNLYAPKVKSSGDPYYGVLIYDAGANTIEFEPGNATGILSGIIYGPEANLFIHDSGSDINSGTQLTFDLDIVVSTFKDQTGELDINSYSLGDGAGTSPLTRVTLVE